MFLSDVKCKLIISPNCFSTIWTDSFISRIFSLWLVNIFDMPDDIKTCVSRIITITTMKIFNFCVHSLDMKRDFSFLGEFFAAQRTRIAGRKRRQSVFRRKASVEKLLLIVFSRFVFFLLLFSKRMIGRTSQSLLRWIKLSLNIFISFDIFNFHVIVYEDFITRCFMFFFKKVQEIILFTNKNFFEFLNIVELYRTSLANV